jgi:hypothetical protein
MAPRLPAHPNQRNRVWTRQGGVMKPDLSKASPRVRPVTGGGMPKAKPKRSSTAALRGR